MHLNYLLAFDGVIASRGGIPLIEQGVIIGAIGSSGGTDSQDDIVTRKQHDYGLRPRKRMVQNLSLIHI